ncbi:unnamed protein product, partial [Rotaria socialis]
WSDCGGRGWSRCCCDGCVCRNHRG